MNKYIITFIMLLLSINSRLCAQNYQLSSPDENIKITLQTKPSLHYTVIAKGDTVIPKAEASMTLGNGRVLAKGDKVIKEGKKTVDDIIHPVVAIKNNKIRDRYNQLSLYFREGYKVTFRVYNDAVAYCFSTDFKDSIVVKNEQFDVEFPKGTSAWFSFLTGKDNLQDRWMNEYQHVYSKGSVADLDKSKRTELPLLLDLKNQSKILITESNLKDYPSLYFEKKDNESLQSIFPPRVKENKKNKKGEKGWDRTIHPKSVYDYIAKTSGKRFFPWRIMAIANEDKELLNNEIVYKLAEPNRLKNTDWIKPGQVAWDWWNDWNITGVDFKAGINNKTYEYYIDFAARNDIPYIIMDDGWYELGDLTKEAEDIDVAHLVDYGKQKGVGVILWASWKTLNDQMQEAMDLFEKWGIKGIKVDFMRRDDQDMVNFYWKTAKQAAKRHLLVDFHGSYKPVGLERTYPNIVNYESVSGLEQNKWSDDQATPEMAVSLPFIRMFTGPMDYTPGAMRNAQKKDFRPINSNPMSLGTRSQQVAMYVLYDSPLQMLSDNPTAYEKNKESLDFITSIPTTWDKTIPLQGKVGEYVVMARKKDNEYFVGAMTNWEERDLTIDLSFLPDGNWEIELFKDGENADRNGTDYKKEIKKVNNTDELKIHMAPGGGWAGRIYQYAN